MLTYHLIADIVVKVAGERKADEETTKKEFKKTIDNMRTKMLR